jgi:two-component system nitrogen regulation sensor histidine kinase GlnL
VNPDEILDGLSTAVLMLDERLHILRTNAAAQDLLGMAGSQARDRALTQVLRTSAELDDALARAFEDSGTRILREVQVYIAGGEQRVVDVFVTVLEADDGAPRLLLEIADATQRQRISRDAALLAQLGGSRLMARQLAHEIKNPLGGLRGAAQLLARQLGDDALREYTQVIINEADRLAALVDSMLGPASPPRPETVNLHELCEHIFRLLQGEAPARVTLERDYDPSLPEVALDRNMMVQAMLNVGRNALQALERGPGGGRIVLRTRALHNQNISAVRHRLVCAVQFADDGPGVPADIRETLFYPLVTGREGGSGLGLAVAQELVRRHGGLIEFESIPGRTQFTLLLPVARQDEA